MKKLITLIVVAGLALTMQAQNSITNTVASGESFLIEDAGSGQMFETYDDGNGAFAEFYGAVVIDDQITVEEASYFLKNVHMTSIDVTGAPGDYYLYIDGAGLLKRGATVTAPPAPNKSVNNEIQQLKEENAALKAEMAELRKMVETVMKENR